MTVRAVAAVAAIVVGSAAAAADRQDPHALARDLFQQLIEIKTTESGLGSTPAAEAMAQRLLAGGFAPEDVQVVGPGGRKQNMVARYKGTGRKRPVLLIGHLDVVEALREDWTVDPFKFIEKDGYFYGRGTQDMKDGVAIMVATLLRYRAEGYRPDRDIILALTADEESGTANGVDWLLKNRRELVDAEFVLNHDGGGVTAENGRAVQVDLTASEKGYADFDLIATNPGGHSSAPPRENAIYSVTRALDRVAAHDFAFELNNVTRAYFEHVAKRSDPARAAAIQGILRTPPDAQAVQTLSADQIDNAIVRTTCVATRLYGGHANNALPQTARANVNCRVPDSLTAICLCAHANVAVIAGESPHFTWANSSSLIAGSYRPSARRARTMSPVGGNSSSSPASSAPLRAKISLLDPAAAPRVPSAFSARRP